MLEAEGGAVCMSCRYVIKPPVLKKAKVVKRKKYPKIIRLPYADD